MKKSIFGTIVLAALSLVHPTKSDAQLKMASIEALQSVNPELSYGRLNLAYGLGNKFSGFTFAELYPDNSKAGSGYFCKSNIDRSILEFGPVTISGRGMLVTGTDFNDRAGLGVKASANLGDIAGLQNVSIAGYAIPAFIEGDGSQTRSKNAVGYSLGFKLPGNVSASMFAEFNTNGKCGAEHGYGEISIAKDLGFISEDLSNVSVSCNPAMRNVKAGSTDFKLDHRVAITYTYTPTK